MTPRQWILAAVGRLQERGDYDLARQLADAERCVSELEEAAKQASPHIVMGQTIRHQRLLKALANMERVKG